MSEPYIGRSMYIRKSAPQKKGWDTVERILLLDVLDISGLNHKIFFCLGDMTTFGDLFIHSS